MAAISADFATHAGTAKDRALNPAISMNSRLWSQGRGHQKLAVFITTRLCVYGFCLRTSKRTYAWLCCHWIPVFSAGDWDAVSFGLSVIDCCCASTKKTWRSSPVRVKGVEFPLSLWVEISCGRGRPWYSTRRVECTRSCFGCRKWVGLVSGWQPDSLRKRPFSTCNHVCFSSTHLNSYPGSSLCLYLSLPSLAASEVMAFSSQGVNLLNGTCLFRIPLCSCITHPFLFK